MIEWILPLEIQSPNVREHWSKGFARNKRNKERIAKAWALEPHKPSSPCTISIQRLYNPSKCEKRMDDDNMVFAMKGVRDCLADLIIPGHPPGQADNLKLGITFQYEQLTATRKGIRIVIMEQEEINESILG
jgi:hypothetical protein